MDTRDILKKLMEVNNISARKLATVTKSNRSTLSSILDGTNKSSQDKTLLPYAEYFGVSLAQLRGYESIDELSTARAPLLKQQLPLLLPHQVEDWLEGRINKAEYPDLVPTTREWAPRVFAMDVQDDAIESRLNKGATCVVDPDFNYPDNAAVVAPKIALIRAGAHYGFRIVLSNLGKNIYKADSSGFDSLTDDECERIGYVVGVAEKMFVAATNNT